MEPFASLVTLPAFSVPRLLINRELVGPFSQRKRRTTDVVVTGDLVEGVRRLVGEAGWEGELEAHAAGWRERVMEWEHSITVGCECECECVCHMLVVEELD